MNTVVLLDVLVADPRHADRSEELLLKAFHDGSLIKLVVHTFQFQPQKILVTTLL